MFRPRGGIRRFRFGRKANRRRPHWTAQIADAVTIIASPNPLSSLVVAVGDYSSNSNLSKTGVTLKRVVGNISLLHTDAVACTVWMALFTSNQDEGTAQQDPANFQHLIDEDVMWTHVHRFGTDTATNREVTIPVDVRVARRLIEDEVRLQFASTNGAGTVTASVVLRALLSGDMI